MRAFSHERLRNFYQVLQVPTSASHKEIKAQYYKLCKKLHPDYMNSESSHFLTLNDAYQILKDPLKRSQYDFKLGIKAAGHVKCLQRNSNNQAVEFAKSQNHEKKWQRLHGSNSHHQANRGLDDDLHQDKEVEWRLFKMRFIVLFTVLTGYGVAIADKESRR